MLIASLAVVAVAGAGVALLVGPLTDAVREITLPLKHEDIIRQQAREKGLDPALVAAVIYQESKFRDQTSHAGARGLMQITPDTAQLHRAQVGRHPVRRGRPRDAADQHRLRLVLPPLPAQPLRRERPSSRSPPTTPARPTSTAGSGDAGGPGTFDRVRDIPFPETRAYVQAVFDRRGEYRDHYADELGL